MANNANRISLIIPAQDVADAMNFFKQGFDKLKPHLLEALSKEEFDSLAKIGEKTIPFVDKGIGFAKTNPNLVPRRCDVVEAEKDFGVFEVLQEVDILVEQIAKRISHTRVVAGAEALDCINKFYSSIKEDAEDGNADAIPIYNELKTRYAKVGKYERKPVTPGA